MRFSHPALALMDQQLGLVTRPQLRRVGYGDTQIDAMLRRGHLEAVHRGTFRRTGSGAPGGQEALAGVLRCGPRARITGARVLALLGCEGHDPASAPFTVLVPQGRRVRGVDFPVRTDAAFERDGAHYGPLPGTTPARTLLERALDAVDDERLLLDFDRLRWRRLLERHRLEQLVAALPWHRGARRWTRLLRSEAAGQESPGERALARVAAELPPLEWQAWVAPDLRVDALWRDVAVVLEYDGAAVHGDARDRARDAVRHERLRDLGFLVVPVTARDLEDTAALVARLRSIRARRLRARA